MLSRRKLLKLTGRAVATTVCLAIAATVGQIGLGQGPPRGPVLKERLLVGLRVKTESDREFIDRVVILVERQILPIKLVDSTYFWARKKAARSRRLQNNPMVYFRPALIARAERLGIRI